MSAAGWVLLAGGMLAGLFVGSFCNVVIDRLPLALDAPNEYGELWDTNPWGHVLGVGEGADSRSRCSSCGAQLRWSDNIPVVSYLRLRGRCRSCGEPYGAYHLWVELAVPIGWLLVTWGVVHFQGWTWALVPYLLVVPSGITLCAIDYRTLMLPTRIIWPTFAAVLLSTLALALVDGHPEWVLHGAIGIAVIAGPLFVFWWFVPSGFGDVRLGVLMGFLVGVAAASTGGGYLQTVLLGLIGLVLSAGYSLVDAVRHLLFGRTRQVNVGKSFRKQQVPFGPGIFVGAMLCVVFAQPILEPFGR